MLADDYQADELADEDIRQETYFTKPSQLMKIFHTLEEQNLFLIQTFQATEQAKEELDSSMRNQKTSMKEKG